MMPRFHCGLASPRRLRRGGYTLIELMVSMAIFSMVMLAATAAYISFIAYNRQAQATAAVMNSLSFSIDTMAREIRSGTAYSVVGNVITFTNADGCAVIYQLANSAITRTVTQQNGCMDVETNGPITDSPAVVVKNFRAIGRGAPNNLQPMVIIDINGYATVPNTGAAATAVKIPFQIETAATQRLPFVQ